MRVLSFFEFNVPAYIRRPLNEPAWSALKRRLFQTEFMERLLVVFSNTIFFVALPLVDSLKQNVVAVNKSVMSLHDLHLLFFRCKLQESSTAVNCAA